MTADVVRVVEQTKTPGLSPGGLFFFLHPPLEGEGRCAEARSAEASGVE